MNFKNMERIESSIKLLEKLNSNPFVDDFNLNQHILNDIINQYFIENSFSKVINSAKRYDIATIESYDIEKIGPINSQEYNKYLLNKENKFKILSSNKIAGEGKAFYYIVFNKNNEKFIYVLECTKEFILTLRKYLKSYSIDKEL